MMIFIYVVSFLGIFSLTPLRKVMVMDYKLTYPSGTATATLINSFHTHSGAEHQFTTFSEQTRSSCVPCSGSSCRRKNSEL
ncbi:hypothetical protein AgCh_013057 [Apium graveolens]